MPRARVGSLAFRYRGSSVGFRVHSDSEVVGVKEFVQVRNAEGQVSNWLPADDFILTPRNERRLKIYWLVLYKTTAVSPVSTSFCESYATAQSVITGVRNNGYILVATKKITLEIDQ